MNLKEMSMADLIAVRDDLSKTMFACLHLLTPDKRFPKDWVKENSEESEKTMKLLYSESFELLDKVRNEYEGRLKRLLTN